VISKISTNIGKNSCIYIKKEENFLFFPFFSSKKNKNFKNSHLFKSSCQKELKEPHKKIQLQEK
jgi:hypothetical protein